ncbi:hypothetical protein pipiens_014749 [Culex pipiens pipiens]|uniref:tRNA (32-2'-O)-methyltransferase regulator THADA-like C-terminal TPR repeats region domain-containing protein n=1 Tax=Culex pipiens pipiens TaxID=38569 RepID=A0ABD1CT99_CULPP
MTGRIFFLRYPQLYDFFMKELEIASQIISKGARSKKLHPLLLLLSRLYPSALEGSESNLKLSQILVRCQNVIFMEDDQFLDDLHNIVDYFAKVSG